MIFDRGRPPQRDAFGRPIPVPNRFGVRRPSNGEELTQQQLAELFYAHPACPDCGSRVVRRELGSVLVSDELRPSQQDEALQLLQAGLTPSAELTACRSCDWWAVAEYGQL